MATLRLPELAHRRDNETGSMTLSIGSILKAKTNLAGTLPIDDTRGMDAASGGRHEPAVRVVVTGVPPLDNPAERRNVILTTLMETNRPYWVYTI